MDGNYVMSGVVPNYLNGDRYSLEFNAPGAGASTASLGRADSDFTNGLQRIDDIVVQPGSNVSDLNLPIDPNGVVYDAVLRSPIAGAVVTLVDAQSGTPVPSGCFYDPAQQDQVTLADGYYKFDINFSAGCPSGSAYSIQVVPPGAAYFPGTSALIPSASDGSTPPFDVPGCPGSAQDAIVATNQYCEAQASALAPAASVPARSAGTVYYKHLLLDDSQQPGSAQLFNNHIPLDPILGGAVSITKTTPRVDVTRGELVPYTITLTNTFGADLPNVTVVDRFPAGFHYVEGSARLDGVATEPIIVDRELRWEDLLLTSSNDQTIQLLLAVGAGVGEGEFTNHAFAVNSISGGALSGDATATVRLVPDPTFDCSDVTGKVFDDANRNGYQDPGEDGIAGVRVVTVSGLTATTDTYGRYHFTCAITPHESRGSNIVLKLDDRTLPSGFRLSTSPVKVQRATRGKALRINFGASIHRVVGLVYSKNCTRPRPYCVCPTWRTSRTKA
ncbi:MAG: SdrD B-like domain-containing protein [Gammaproteobacteria bacterium]